MGGSHHKVEHNREGGYKHLFTGCSIFLQLQPREKRIFLHEIRTASALKKIKSRPSSYIVGVVHPVGSL